MVTYMSFGTTTEEFPEEKLYNKFDYYKKPGLVKELQQFFSTKVLGLN